MEDSERVVIYEGVVKGTIVRLCSALSRMLWRSPTVPPKDQKVARRRIYTVCSQVPPRGANDFGFDRVFQPEGSDNKTLAEAKPDAV